MQSFAFKTIRAIVTFGWAIYPIGYYLAYMSGGTHDNETLKIVYNLADLVNKDDLLFGLRNKRQRAKRLSFFHLNLWTLPESLQWRLRTDRDRDKMDPYFWSGQKIRAKICLSVGKRWKRIEGYSGH